MQDFRNRLQKVYRHIRKWAKRSNVSCYRIYDWDIPNHPLVIDKYDDCLHIAIYKTRKEVPEKEYLRWVQESLAIVSELIEIPLERIYLKQRRKLDRKVEQYEKFAQEHKTMLVQESGLTFKVNMTDYLDTGLFLDHRPLRQRFMAVAKDKKVLNLFAYTGAFSVYAAHGGAHRVVTVDLSNTYINWAKENFEHNSLDMASHRFVVSDTLQFLEKDTEFYDLVIVDPPSFSNSKKVKTTWDTQRDHNLLLSLIAKRLNKGATVYFSNNLRTFEPNFEGLPFDTIEEISKSTVPEDYRNKKIHRSFKMTF